jgi:F-type H+-transporting ATPase subunit gamma
VRNVGFENAQGVAENILQRYAAGEFDVATLFFSRFKSVIAQIPTAQRIIPANAPAPAGDQTAAARPADVHADAAGAAVSYEYEPEEEDILAELLPRYIGTQIFRALLENAASEQGARMSAMDNATRKQTLTYNRTRQALITKELIEIISGAEAL